MDLTVPQPGLIELIRKHEAAVRKGETIGLFGFYAELAALDPFDYSSNLMASTTEFMHKNNLNQNSRNKVYQRAMRRHAFGAVPDKNTRGMLWLLADIFYMNNPPSDTQEQAAELEKQKSQIVSSVPQSALSTYFEGIESKYHQVFSSITENRGRGKAGIENISGEEHLMPFMREKNLFTNLKPRLAELYKVK